MNTQNAEMDVESLQKRRRGGFLDVFLVSSVVFLFAAVTTLAVVGVMAVKDVESRLKSPLESTSWTSESESLTLTGDLSGTAFTNFAYLEATTSGLKNATMQWAVQQTSVGSNFQYNRDNHWMMPLHSGMYFMYVNLNLTCTYRCDAGVFTIHVGDKLTCKVHLQQLADSTVVNEKCWTVSRVASKQKLISHMTVPKEGLEYWSLEMGFGMFRVD